MDSLSAATAESFHLLFAGDPELWIIIFTSFSVSLRAILIAVPIGVISAYKQYSLFDNLGTVVTMVGFSLPVFFTGLLSAKHTGQVRLQTSFTSISARQECCSWSGHRPQSYGQPKCVRVLFARAGIQHCAACHKPISSQTREQILGRIHTVKRCARHGPQRPDRPRLGHAFPLFPATAIDGVRGPRIDEFR